ncbi:MAG: hypothetical protein PHI47_10650 [Sulfuricurvum sp.]|uniref:hypothetical protein n=1 Tax=Sulfuricurvum sp. TaxID=2025608 RepID=UPI002635AB6F|nr:hypothetical protein [Sulfuricurvum sp.]MDD5160501.1 hypothetical protein [Sulfuricurvum sp.]
MQKSNIDKEKLILSIFTELSVPFLAIDFQRLKKTLERFSETKSYIAIPIKDDEKLLISALRGILKQYDVPDIMYILLLKSELFIKNNNIHKMYSEKNLYTLQMDGNNLVWEESSLWPLAYSSFIQQLVSLTKNFKVLLEERKKERKKERNYSKNK